MGCVNITMKVSIRRPPTGHSNSILIYSLTPSLLDIVTPLSSLLIITTTILIRWLHSIRISIMATPQRVSSPTHFRMGTLQGMATPPSNLMISDTIPHSWLDQNLDAITHGSRNCTNISSNSPHSWLDQNSDAITHGYRNCTNISCSKNI
jgi:hypothetical protein